MAQRASGFARAEKDFYATPAWVVDALAETVDLRMPVWEPACGTGSMARALEARGATVLATDIVDRGYTGMNAMADFTATLIKPARLVMASGTMTPEPPRAIITNPPYGTGGRLGVAFAERGLAFIREDGVHLMALLLPVDFNSAAGRRHIFADCREFAGKVTLLRRINWVGMEPGPGEAGSSQNHAWFLWRKCGIPGARRERTIAYAPTVV